MSAPLLDLRWSWSRWCRGRGGGQRLTIETSVVLIRTTANLSPRRAACLPRGTECRPPRQPPREHSVLVGPEEAVEAVDRHLDVAVVAEADGERAVTGGEPLQDLCLPGLGRERALDLRDEQRGDRGASPSTKSIAGLPLEKSACRRRRGRVVGPPRVEARLGQRAGQFAENASALADG